MKVLFVSVMSNPLNHPKDGDAQRTRLLLQACAKIAEVDLITFAGKSDGEMDRVKVVYDKRIYNHETKLSRLEKWITVLPVTGINALFPINKRYESIVDGIVQSGGYDFIVSRYFHRTLLCGLWKYHDKLVLDFDDSPSSFFINQIDSNSTTSFKIRARLAAWKSEKISKKAVKKIYAAFFSDVSLAKAYKAWHLPNIPYYDYICPLPDFDTKHRRILFVGQLDYLPNRKGLDRFFDRIYLPLVNKNPNLEVHIVGSLSDNNVRERWMGYPGVTICGFVEDLYREYEEAHLVVIPIYQCGGTNIKLLEAMKMNRACVTTKTVVDKLNLNLDNGYAYYAAANDDEFVKCLELLLKDDQLNVKMATAGRREVEKYYSFDAFCSTVSLAMKE